MTERVDLGKLFDAPFIAASGEGDELRLTFRASPDGMEHPSDPSWARLCAASFIKRLGLA